MNQRTRSPKKLLAIPFSPPSKIDDKFHKFLRPGALARLRDTRISSRSPRTTAFLLVTGRAHRLSPPPSAGDGGGAAAGAQIPAALFDGSHFFAGRRVRGPRFPQRKKLHASRAVFLIPGSPAESPADDLSILDQMNSDFLLAH
ncbi:uncharacterized protein LOC144708498 [Wolffia australiana]